jgi:hypothetical protein
MGYFWLVLWTLIFFWRITFIYTRIDFYGIFENRKVNGDIPRVMTSGHPPIVLRIVAA